MSGAVLAIALLGWLPATLRPVRLSRTRAIFPRSFTVGALKPEGLPQSAGDSVARTGMLMNAMAAGQQTKVTDEDGPWSTSSWLARDSATADNVNVNVTVMPTAMNSTTSVPELKLKQESEKKKKSLKKKQKGSSTSDKPTSSIALDGGDIWAGSRLSEDEMHELVDNVTSKRVSRPVTSQWFPSRRWLWGQWAGTIVKAVLPREVLFATTFSTVAALSLHLISGSYDVSQQLLGVQRVWVLCSGLISFTLSFFLSKAYTLWRSVYLNSRKVQNRLNDLGLVCATAAARAHENGSGFTPEADEMLQYLARMCRLYSLLLYASLTTRFAPLVTPAGLKLLQDADAVTDEERRILLESSNPQYTVLMWLSLTLRAALKDGRLDCSYDRTIQTKVLDLRDHSASIRDELSGRIPLAYTHLMQLLCDLLVVFTPLAMSASVGGIICVFTTALVTLFYSSVLKLAKHFCDPYDNEQYDGQKNGIAINVECLVQETNFNSERWRRSAIWLPECARGL